jgi:hypothetical protein
MPKKLKVYSSSQYFVKEPSIRQCRAVVAAPSKKRAAELLNHSMYTFNNYASETGNPMDIELAMASPETVIVREVF